MRYLREVRLSCDRICRREGTDQRVMQRVCGMRPALSCRGNRAGGEAMTGSYDILIVGIGGQGTILASNILGEACLIEGRHVKGAETHGMAQRGGSVESYIRIDGEFGPLIAPGQADLLISFDLLEALRYSHFLKKDGKIVVNRHLVLPTWSIRRISRLPRKRILLLR